MWTTYLDYFFSVTNFVIRRPAEFPDRNLQIREDPFLRSQYEMRVKGQKGIESGMTEGMTEVDNRTREGG